MHQNPSSTEVDRLSEVTIGSRYSGFGVILDSTRGVRVKNPYTVEYSTQLKLIDSSLHSPPRFEPNHTRGHLTFFIFWTNEENQPFPYKIGDIMRFTNFDFEKYRDQVQGKNRKGSSWCIFHGDSTNNEMYSQSVEYKEKLSQFHVKHLHDLRQWSTNYFQQYSIKELDWYSYDRHIESPSTFQSFDMLLRVGEIRPVPDQPSEVVVHLADERLTRYQTNLSSRHMTFMKEGDIIKVRSIEKIDGNNNYLRGNNRYFAAIGIPTTFKDYKQFVEVINIQESQEMRRVGDMDVEGDYQNCYISLYPGFDTSILEKKAALSNGGSILSSIVSQQYALAPKLTAFEVLRELEQNTLERTFRDDRKFHLRLTLVDIKPKPLIQSLRNECKTCRLVRRLDAPEGETCCQRKMEKTMLLRLLWQDQSLKASRKVLVTYLVPVEREKISCIFPDLPLSEVKTGSIEAFESMWQDALEKYLEDDRLFDIMLEPFDNATLKDKDGQTPLRVIETLFVPVMQKST